MRSAEFPPNASSEDEGEYEKVSKVKAAMRRGKLTGKTFTIALCLGLVEAMFGGGTSTVRGRCYTMN